MKVFGYTLPEVLKAIGAAIGMLVVILTLVLGPDNKWTLLVGGILAAGVTYGVFRLPNTVDERAQVLRDSKKVRDLRNRIG